MPQLTQKLANPTRFMELSAQLLPWTSGLAAVLLGYRRDHLPLQVVGLDPSPTDVAYFRRLLGESVSVSTAPRPGAVRPRSRTPFPWALVALALAGATTLAAGALWAPRLEWRS
jgi:hypothetical protein